MASFLLRRLGSGVVLVLVVTAVTSLLIYSGGSDIARNILGNTATQEQVDQLGRELGLDRPAFVQYWDWLRAAVTGDFGSSYFTNEPVVQAMANRIPVTLSLVIWSVLLTAVISALLGLLSAVKRGWLDSLVQIFNVAAGAIPPFWLALVLVSAFAISMPLLPATGYVPLAEDPGGWARSLVLPVASLVVGSVGTAAIVRSSVIDILRLDFVRTLRAHGIPMREVLFRHVFRNAAPAWLTIMSLQFIGMMGGAVVIERVFAIPGLGTLATNAAQSGDIPIVLGVVAVTVGIIVVVNLLLDLANGWLNPKARIA